MNASRRVLSDTIRLVRLSFYVDARADSRLISTTSVSYTHLSVAMVQNLIVPYIGKRKVQELRT